jgi:hypothetical protein
MPDVVEVLLVQPECTPAVVNRAGTDGTAFKIACELSRESRLSSVQRGQIAACARLLRSKGQCDLNTLSSSFDALRLVFT